MHRKSNHTLVVGGTGMLRECSLALAKISQTLSVLARNPRRMDRLEQEIAVQGFEFSRLLLDYHDSDAVKVALQAASNDCGLIDCVVHWSHGSAPEIPRIVAERVGSIETPAHFFHVLGSAAANPSQLPKENDLLELPNIHYHAVILGFVLEQGYSRWLTNQEISQGVLDAMIQPSPRYIVGTVEPWSARP